jgi:hypothetical protein
MSFKEDLDKAIKYVANMCIENNWYRNGNTFPQCFHEFDHTLITTLNEKFPLLSLCGGYCFLNESGGEDGLIRFLSGNANPKYSFFLKDGKVQWDWA